MTYPEDKGQTNKVLNTGRIAYVGDGTDFYPMKGISGRALISQREPFIFYPGAATVLAGSSTVTGMVLSGVRSGGASTTTAGSVTTVWTPTVTYAPARSGKIEGLVASGIISGQITIGAIVTTAATSLVGLTARIRNSGGTWTTCLWLSATTIAVGGTTEVYTTYDIPRLPTTADFNAVPFDFAIGVQSSYAAASAAVRARIMESSYIMGEFEPGT